jgi:hypothetical protein
MKTYTSHLSLEKGGGKGENQVSNILNDTPRRERRKVGKFIRLEMIHRVYCLASIALNESKNITWRNYTVKL